MFFSVLFARDSLLISAFVLILTVFLKNITKAKEVPPAWMSWASTIVAQRVFYNYYSEVKRNTHKLKTNRHIFDIKIALIY